MWWWRGGRRGGGGSQTRRLLLLLLPALFLFSIILSGGPGMTDNAQLELDNKLIEIRDHLDHLKQLDREKSKAFMELRGQILFLLGNSGLNNPPSPLLSNNSASRLGSNSSGGTMISDPNGIERSISESGGRSNVTADLRTVLRHGGIKETSVGPSLAPDYGTQSFKINGSNIGPGVRNSVLSNLSLIGMDVSIPNLYDFLPHLLKKPAASLAPVVRLASPKKRRNLHTVIGIPTIKRPKVSYLITTLRSLIDNLSREEMEEVLIVVMIAEEKGVTEFVSEQVVVIQSEFKDYIEQGLLEIIVPPSDYYPEDLASLPSTFGDSQERMMWRTKQNLDYAYLMMYSQNRAHYYMQLEDDVITKPGYFSRMKDFIGKHSSSPWLLLEFSSLGFIGKLFKGSDLPVIIEFLLMFHREKPVDWLLDHIFFVKLCHPEKTPKQCQQVKNQYRIRYKPSLFQHIGVHSSLKGKVQKLKERDFGKQAMHKSHGDNPPAKLETSLKVYQKYSLDRAYNGDSFFWGLLPQPNDWIKFTFDPPIRLEGFLFRSGNAEHPNDRFYNTSVSIRMVPEGKSSAMVDLHANTGTVGSKFGPGDDNEYTEVAWFTPSGTAQATLNTTRLVHSLRIVVHTESDNWIIINEMWIRQLRT